LSSSRQAGEQVITRYANLGASQVQCERDDIVGFIDILTAGAVQPEAIAITKIMTTPAKEEQEEER
jgi:hypothetical protein